MSTYLIGERIQVHHADASTSISYERIQVLHTCWVEPGHDDSEAEPVPIPLGPIRSTGEVQS